MKQRMMAAICIAALLFGLCGCSLVDQVLDQLSVTDSTAPGRPGRMVQRLDVSLYPKDPDFDREYRSQDTLEELLKLLRDMQSNESPEREPDLNGGQAYFLITATYSSGESQTYYLLGHRYLKLGDDPWCVIPTDQAMRLNSFLQEHPSENPNHSSYDTVPSTVETVPIDTQTIPESSEA